ncbi:UDP-N-acetylmuramate dehydrogenase [Ferrovum myxofaciens]|jgi:UDP-N-acetylmuramate dehydrogenase|uniref:UDP-N-acetylenolpyruvoylglucosamine reductase n=1 Tax=Ferrovum myxofaciens TaxID=416213 RepID=A0A149VWT0_9PROT|nr:UDP-N-acetylmuramate dehydrogenase [Ferrovum myxofaciens]KXW57685.1 UDP-N-acetylenolpyruvoylglucosamine reductase [Ferrovum myxofaciens]MBW8028971.1 UDP-N-acetylmuramate dehydrogenase [Ferrovum sp.]NDU90326.1 UDP-N-acetylmuramate dehydrogenase [Ferrovum sp.]
MMPAHQGDSGELRRNEPMSQHVSWRAGGRARQFYRPRHREDFLEFLHARPAQETLFLLGLGSNLLVREGGIDATVVQMHGALKEVKWEEGCLRIEAGVPAPKVARLAARAGCSGAEFLAGIPGTMGGVLAMNAGCYGAEIWNFVCQVETVDRLGVLRWRTPGDYDIGYRSVRLREECRLGPEEWFLSVLLHFPEGDAETARTRIRSLLAQRVADQPLEFPNAGSVFRNPAGGYAARLIEGCGLKGKRIGGAEVSLKHANFIVNRGQATATDIEILIAEIQSRILAEKGVCLHPEVRIVGERA